VAPYQRLATPALSAEDRSNLALNSTLDQTAKQEQGKDTHLALDRRCDPNDRPDGVRQVKAAATKARAQTLGDFRTSKLRTPQGSTAQRTTRQVQGLKPVRGAYATIGNPFRGFGRIYGVAI
jgi:hypothetical protein